MQAHAKELCELCDKPAAEQDLQKLADLISEINGLLELDRRRLLALRAEAPK